VDTKANIFLWEDYQTAFTTQTNPTYYNGVKESTTPVDTIYILYNLLVSHKLEKAIWVPSPSLPLSYQGQLTGGNSYIAKPVPMTDINKIQEVALSLNQDPIQYETLFRAVVRPYVNLY
jgi:hypothetical protein